MKKLFTLTLLSLLTVACSQPQHKSMMQDEKHKSMMQDEKHKSMMKSGMHEKMHPSATVKKAKAVKIGEQKAHH